MNNVISMLLAGGFGAFILRFAAPIAEAFRKFAPKLSEFLLGLDDKADAKLQEVSGGRLAIPDFARDLYEESVRMGVAFAESMLGSKDFWEELLFIIKGNKGLVAGRLLNLLEEWITNGIDTVAPPELKELINQVKLAEGTKVAMANLATLPITIDEAQVRASVSAAAPLAGRVIMQESPIVSVPTSEILIRIAETRKKLDEAIKK